MSHTSKEAYASIVSSLGEKQRIVLSALGELGIANNRAIAHQLGWEINRVTGRVNELRKLGRVELAYTNKDVTGKRTKCWRVKNPVDNQVPLIQDF
jgi:DNA-binding MarR family transcriptional regulator